MHLVTYLHPRLPTDSAEEPEIYYHDIAAGVTQKLTNNTRPDYESKINDQHIVWIQYDDVGKDREVMLYNRSTATTTQLSDNTVNEGQLLLDGSNLVWVSDTGSGFSDDSLYCHDAVTGTSKVIATNVSFTAPVAISDRFIVYSGWDGHDTEIYVYEISSGTTTQLTDNEQADEEPQVRGERIVWQVYDGPEDEGDWEIMLATLQEVTASSDIFFPVRTEEGKTVILGL
jgi:Tol biopolymer transport system component